MNEIAQLIAAIVGATVALSVEVRQWVKLLDKRKRTDE